MAIYSLSVTTSRTVHVWAKFGARTAPGLISTSAPGSNSAMAEPSPTPSSFSYPSQGSGIFYPYPQALPPPTPPPKPKRIQVRIACTNCAAACKRCDDERPCTRCQKYDLVDTCADGLRKERKKGVKRGPYKRKPKIPTPSPVGVPVPPLSIPGPPPPLPGQLPPPPAQYAVPYQVPEGYPQPCYPPMGVLFYRPPPGSPEGTPLVPVYFPLYPPPVPPQGASAPTSVSPATPDAKMEVENDPSSKAPNGTRGKDGPNAEDDADADAEGDDEEEEEVDELDDVDADGDADEV
ncbi:Zn(2)-C6 fungal-type domain-containing protein [Mycena kentingensis (nom. inval.)]|nr:Zn(2)-C6 fungal-type domain-containing protein [Mycena kentingensis (nom. inval.)]